MTSMRSAFFSSAAPTSASERALLATRRSEVLSEATGGSDVRAFFAFTFEGTVFFPALLFGALFAPLLRVLVVLVFFEVGLFMSFSRKSRAACTLTATEAAIL